MAVDHQVAGVFFLTKLDKRTLQRGRPLGCCCSILISFNMVLQSIMVAGAISFVDMAAEEHQTNDPLPPKSCSDAPLDSSFSPPSTSIGATSGVPRGRGKPPKVKQVVAAPVGPWLQQNK